MGIIDFKAGDIIGGVTKLLDSTFTSDEERLEKKNEAQKAQLDYGILEEQEHTKRWESDNENALTRLVRPAIVAYVMFLFTVVIFADGNIGDFKINKAYIPLIEMLLVTTVGGYFVLREIGKHSKNKYDKKGK